MESSADLLERGDEGETETDELAAAHDVIAEAIDGDADPDEAAKKALGEVAAHNATNTSTPASVEAGELLEGVLGADGDEKVNLLKQARHLLE